MIKKLSFLLLSTFTIACSNTDDTIDFSAIEGEFSHTIPECDNSVSAEINCTEFIDFMNNNRVSILIGGTDIMVTTNYRLVNNQIILEQNNDLDFAISFSIENETTLIRVENNTIWSKIE